MGGLVGYGAYVPYYQLERTRIAGVLGSGGGSGTRSVAAFDEDTTSMAVAAGRAALASLSGPGGQPDRACVRQLFFATTVPAYADKTNATAVHAALRRPATVGPHWDTARWHVEGIVMAASPWAGSDFQFPPRPTSPVALCGACSRLGSCRLGLGREELQTDGSVHTDLVCGPENEGGPDVAHGGWTAGVFDEVLGHVPVLNGCSRSPASSPSATSSRYRSGARCRHAPGWCGKRAIAGTSRARSPWPAPAWSWPGARR